MTKTLLFLHWAGAVCALAVSIHLLVRLRTCWERGGAGAGRVKTHAVLLALLYATTLLLGALLYPAFRVDVRHAFLDAEHPRATGWFEIKEHAAALGLMPALALAILAARLPWQRPEGRRYLPLLTALAAFVLLALTLATVTGWYLVTIRSV